MIQANELRIGNWFLEFGIPTQADGRFIDILQNIQLRNKTAIDISAIPLTPEILLKCGFEKKETTKQYGWYITVGERELCWCYADYISLEFKDGQLDDFGGTIKDINCKHLHQLQNLYFALTGEELTFKP